MGGMYLRVESNRISLSFSVMISVSAWRCINIANQIPNIPIRSFRHTAMQQFIRLKGIQRF